MLADEPTGNLDATSAAELMKLMVELSESRSVAFLVVTHDATMLHHFDRVLTLSEGDLEESKRGKPAANECAQAGMKVAVSADADGLSHVVRDQRICPIRHQVSLIGLVLGVGVLTWWSM